MFKVGQKVKPTSAMVEEYIKYGMKVPGTGTIVEVIVLDRAVYNDDCEIRISYGKDIYRWVMGKTCMLDDGRDRYICYKPKNTPDV